MMRRILIALAYLLTAAVIVIGTVVLVAYGKGYSYDFKKHQFILNGLVIVESEPSGGMVVIEGRGGRHKTPYRSTLEVGDYQVTVTKDGFRPWTKQLRINASAVTFAQYILLFPEKINISRVKTSQARGLAASQDNKKFAFVTGGEGGGVWTVDVGGKKVSRIYTPQAAAPERGAEILQEATWSPDAARLLLRSEIDGDIVYKVIEDSGKGEPINLTELFRSEFKDLRFDPADSNQMYWINPQGDLRRIDLAARTVSAVLADRVTSYSVGGGRVFYVHDTNLGRSLGSFDADGKEQELVQSLAVSPSYEISYIKYEGTEYLAVIPADSRTLTLYKNIFSTNIEAQVLAKQVDKLSPSPDRRFIAFYSADSVGSYDFEYKQLAHFDGLNGVRDLSWFDEYHLVASVGGQAIALEFDGANRTELAGQILGKPFVTEDLRFGVALAESGEELLLLNLKP